MRLLGFGGAGVRLRNAHVARAPRPAMLRLSATAALAALALGTSACLERAGTGVASDEAPQYGGTLVIAAPSDLDNANSLVSTQAYTKEVLRYLLFMPLIQHDDELEFEPHLAESWEVEGDTAVVFRLRRDVRWHDGQPTTAHDVVFTYDRARDPATAFPDAAYFQNYLGAEAVDSFAVRFRFRPHAEPLAGFPFIPIMPRHLLEGVPPAELRTAAFNKAPVGNGPYRFHEYRPGDRWVFAANPDFPEALGGRPYIDRVVWRVVSERTAQATEVETGAAHLALNPGVENIARLDSLDAVRAIIRPARRYAFVGWNGLRAPFDDARVRRALTLAIDRKEILEVLRGGYGELATGPIGPFHWAYDRSIEPLPFDTAAARALLAEAGYVDRDRDGVVEGPDGKPLRFALKIPAGNEFNRDMAVMIQSDLAAVGVRMEVAPTEFSTLIPDISSPERRFDAVLLAWDADFRINIRDNFHSAAFSGPFQSASYRNPEVDRIIGQAELEADRDVARPLWMRLQAIMREEQPWTFLYYYPDVYAVSEKVRGVDMDIRGALAELPRWWMVGAQPTADSVVARQ